MVLASAEAISPLYSSLFLNKYILFYFFEIPVVKNCTTRCYTNNYTVKKSNTLQNISFISYLCPL